MVGAARPAGTSARQLTYACKMLRQATTTLSSDVRGRGLVEVARCAVRN